MMSEVKNNEYNLLNPVKYGFAVTASEYFTECSNSNLPARPEGRSGGLANSLSLGIAHN